MLITRTTKFWGAAVAAFVAMAAASALAADDSAAKAAKAKERELIAVLQSDKPPAEKALTCKALAVFGTKDAVPALAPLLKDERLVSWARIALEAIPGDEADKALREALTSLKGRALIGVINSVGVRRDAGAVDGLAGRLKDTDPEVAGAAAVALGRIGNAPAAKMLRQALADAPTKVRSAVAEGCILCAERFLAEDNAKQAIEIYDEVRQTDVPKQRVLEATRGAILARKADGVPLLVEQLRSADKQFFQIGLSTARELSGREVTDALAGELVRATPDQRAMLLKVLASRGDTVASPVVMQSAKSGPKQVRIAAIGVLGRLGDASCVPTLLEIGIASDKDLADAAKKALADLPGKDVDAAIAAQLPKAEQDRLALLINIVGLRRIEATPALLAAVDHSDPRIRAEALKALGETIGQDDLSVLIRRVAAPKNPEDVKAAHAALRAACIRMPDGEQCAEKLIAAMTGKPTSTKSSFLEILGAMGGQRALLAIGSAAKESDAQLQDTGSRLLGQWMTVDAGPVLLDLAKTTPEEKYKIRALRGYIRLARQFSKSNQQRAEMCENALAAATRPAEQELVLAVLEGYPSMEGLKLAVKATQHSALRDEATRVSMVIAKKLGGNAKAAQKLLSQIGQTPVELEIIKAEYGTGDKKKDVTQALRRHAANLRLIVLPSSSYNTSFGGDPAPGVVKQLRVQYRINGKEGEATFAEDAAIVLPAPE